MASIKEKPFLIALPRDPNRSEGLHVSVLIRDLALQAGYLDKKYADSDIDEDPELVYLGMLWERGILEQHPEITGHPGEFVEDGIAMSPDGVSDDPVYPFALHEIKLTKKSCPKTPNLILSVPKWWMYVTQMKCYLKALRSRRAYLHVGFVNNSYQFMRRRLDDDTKIDEKMMSYKIYNMRFTDEEIRENWQMILNHRRTMIRQGKLRKDGTPKE